MLEWECLILDKNIADCTAEDTYTTCKRNTLSVSMWIVDKSSKRKRKNVCVEKTSCLIFLREREGKGLALTQTKRKRRPQVTGTLCTTFYKRTERNQSTMILPFWSGPVTCWRKTKLQCRRVMDIHFSATTAMNTSIRLLSISAKVSWRKLLIWVSVEMQTKAHDIASKFQLFARVHERIAHELSATDEEINTFDSDIVR